MKTMTYKEAKSYNRKLRNAWLADKIESEEYYAKKIDIIIFLRDELETDENLPARYKACFHVRNSNGLGSLMSIDEKYGFANLFAQYHYEELERLMRLQKPSAWKVNFHIRELEKAINDRQEQASA